MYIKNITFTFLIPSLFIISTLHITSCSENFKKADEGVLSSKGDNRVISQDIIDKPTGASPEKKVVSSASMIKFGDKKGRDRYLLEGMVRIQEGEFIMGSDKTDDSKVNKISSEKPLYLDEHPQHTVYVETFYIDRFEVTNAQYWNFSRTYYYRRGRENYPAANVNWFDASDYCVGRGKKLPSEIQWEKAARGTDGRKFPWGNNFDKDLANMEMTGINDAVPVGQYVTDKSPFGVFDLAGNVLEWTDSWYEAYPNSDYKSERFGNTYKVIRGNGWTTGGHYTIEHYSRSAYRLPSIPSIRYRDIGFRCAVEESGIGISYDPYEDMVEIPSGQFVMGSNKIKEKKDTKQRGFGTRRPLYADEFPERKVYLDKFYIDRFEVTNEQYQRFNPRHTFNRGQHNHPVVGIDWYEADQYCRWLGKRLPTESEWEKAARGTDGREFPWGNEFNKEYVNYTTPGTVPVGSYEEGVSPYGVYDMAGNVWEWTYNWYSKYPDSDFESKDFGEKYKVARGGGHGGGGHYNLSSFMRTAHRLALPITFKGEDTGFRCVKD